MNASAISKSDVHTSAGQELHFYRFYDLSMYVPKMTVMNGATEGDIVMSNIVQV